MPPLPEPTAVMPPLTEPTATTSTADDYLLFWDPPPLIGISVLESSTRLSYIPCPLLPPLVSISPKFFITSTFFLSPKEMASLPPEINDCDGDGEMTPLQKHVSFFDRNKDGVIYPWETFQGFRAIGAGLGLSILSALLINGSLAPKTRPGKFLSPLFPIYVKNIKKGKHGSDSGAYDAEGRFVPAKFEEIFQKHAHTSTNYLTSDELQEMIRANRVPKDYRGWFDSKAEWKVLYSLCKDKDGLLPKETVRAAYDGSLFFRMEEEKSSSKRKA